MVKTGHVGLASLQCCYLCEFFTVFSEFPDPSGNHLYRNQVTDPVTIFLCSWRNGDCREGKNHSFQEEGAAAGPYPVPKHPVLTVSLLPDAVGDIQPITSRP